MSLTKLCQQIVVGCLLISSSCLSSESPVVHYYGNSGEYAYKNDYYVELLKVALTNTTQLGEKVTLKQSPYIVSQSRSIALLVEQSDFDVLWANSTKALEEQLTPIKIPLMQGMFGKRVFLIHKDKQHLFADIHHVSQLKRLVAGQSHDWPDTKILRHNGFRVESVSNFRTLHSMLQKSRIDYYPRGINEVWREWLLHKDKGLIIEPRLMLTYPAPKYFFVKKTNIQLAKRLKTGLQLAVADGTLKRLLEQSSFHQHIGQELNVEDRLVFELENPLL